MAATEVAGEVLVNAQVEFAALSGNGGEALLGLVSPGKPDALKSAALVSAYFESLRARRGLDTEQGNGRADVQALEANNLHAHIGDAPKPRSRQSEEQFSSSLFAETVSGLPGSGNRRARGSEQPPGLPPGLSPTASPGPACRTRACCASPRARSWRCGCLEPILWWVLWHPRFSMDHQGVVGLRLPQVPPAQDPCPTPLSPAVAGTEDPAIPRSLPQRSSGRHPPNQCDSLWGWKSMDP